MTVSLWQDRRSDMAREVDVAVIGAGLVGCAIAREVARNGRSVAVLEARALGAGITGRGTGLALAGLLAPYLSAEPLSEGALQELGELAHDNRVELLALCRRHNIPVDRSGAVWLASSEVQAHQQAIDADRLQRAGLRIRFRERGEASRSYGALVSVDDVGVDPILLTNAVLRESRALLYEGCEVFSLQPDQDSIQLIARRGTFRARSVFIAANAWSPLLVPELAPLVAPARVQAALTAPLPRLPDVMGLLGPRQLTFRQLLDGRLLVTSLKDDAAGEHSYADRIADAAQRRLVSAVVELLGLPSVMLTQKWAGTAAVTPDGIPVIGRLESDPRITYAVGFDSLGISLALVAARRAVALALLGNPPGLLSHRSTLRKPVLE